MAGHHPRQANRPPIRPLIAPPNHPQCILPISFLGICDIAAQTKQSSGAWPPLDKSLKDEARVPSRGFLEGEFDGLPDYRPKTRMELNHSAVHYFKLTIVDAINFLEEDRRLARCVLFETARKQRPPLAFRRLRLTGGLLYLDMALSRFSGLLSKGSKLIRKRGTIHAGNKVLANSEFEKECASAKRTILGLEKDFRGNVLNELQEGMIDSKKDIDHAELIARLKDVWCSIGLVYDRVRRTYEKVLAEEQDREREGGPGEEGSSSSIPDVSVGPDLGAFERAITKMKLPSGELTD